MENENTQTTGVKAIDKALAFEQSHLGNPMVQFALLGFAAYGIWTLANKMIAKKAK
jgi:hypothetical protein